MRVDLVTKVALVVIAVCLAALTVRSFLPSLAVAGREEVVKVDLIRIGSWDIGGVVDVNLEKIGGYPIDKGEPLGKE